MMDDEALIDDGDVPARPLLRGMLFVAVVLVAAWFIVERATNRQPDLTEQWRIRRESVESELRSTRGLLPGIANQYEPPTPGNLDDLTSPVPAILGQLPMVERVTVPVAAENPTHRIVHIRDHHFVAWERFAADLQSVFDEPISEADMDDAYAAHLAEVEITQLYNQTLLLCLIDHHGLKSVYIGGLTDDDLPIFEAKIEAMRELPRRIGVTRAWTEELKAMDDPETERHAAEFEQALDDWEHARRLDRLRIGAASQLYMDRKLESVLPADDAEAYAEANPITEDGAVDLDPQRIEAREDAIVRRLVDSEGCKLLILGGAHDLSDNVARLGKGNVELIVVDTQAWERFGE